MGPARRKRSWGYFMNLGFKCAEGRYICLISDDSVVHPDTIANGVDRFDRDRASGRKLGGLAFYWRSWPEEDKYRVGVTLAKKLFVNHGLFLRDAIAEVEWIDEDRYGFYCADGDLSLKLWDAGYEVDACEQALLEHFEHAGVTLRQRNLQALDADWQNYLARWTGKFYDPADPFPGGWIHLEGVAPRDPGLLFPPNAVPPRVDRGAGRALHAAQGTRDQRHAKAGTDCARNGKILVTDLAPAACLAAARVARR